MKYEIEFRKYLEKQFSKNSEVQQHINYVMYFIFMHFSLEYFFSKFFHS
jgi:hypothetical protein